MSTICKKFSDFLLTFSLTSFKLSNKIEYNLNSLFASYNSSASNFVISSITVNLIVSKGSFNRALTNSFDKVFKILINLSLQFIDKSIFSLVKTC